MLRFEPAHCTLPEASRPTQLRGRFLFLGDSIMRYQFDELVAWLRRLGAPLRCVAAEQPEWRGGGSAMHALLASDAYERPPVDCSRPVLTLMARRLNLLPPAGADGAAAFLSRLVAPAGAGGVVIINVGLWYPMLARHPAFEPGEADTERRAAAARALLADGAWGLARLACARRDWPQLLWREALPQHFGRTGEYAPGGAREASCGPLAESAAVRLHARLAKPAIEAVAASHAQPGCQRPVEVLPSFWPLAAMHEEHTAWRGRLNASRADCTHWLPCSSAMHLQLRLLVAGLSAVRTGRELVGR